MEITKEEIQRLAELGRVKITEKEAERYKKEAKEIVGFFDEIKEVETDGGEAEQERENTSEAVRDEERIDVGTDKEPEQFIAKEKGYLKVPKVF